MRFRRIALAGLFVVSLGLAATPAQAIHFFNGCGKTLQPASAGSAATVTVAGFAFTDQATTTSVTHVKAGDSVTWTWGDTFCHSVTEGVFGGQSYGVQQQVPPPSFTTRGTSNVLAEPDGANNSFTYTFDQPGVYHYYCDHHVEVGMQGTVIVDGPVPAPPAP
jgi:plastocyanin